MSAALAARPQVSLRALVVFFAAATAVAFLVQEAERSRLQGRALEELAYYPSGRWLVSMSVGERAAMADLTWLRAVQYYGEHRQTDNRFQLLYHVFDIVTSLDPRHRDSYVFGGTSLAQEGGQFASGMALLEKGRENQPDSWVYPFEIGFLYFVERRDHATASAWFREAARKPECPDFVARFAAYSAGRAGFVAQAIELWERVALATSNPVLRSKAVTEVRKLARGTVHAAAVERWARGVEQSSEPLPPVLR